MYNDKINEIRNFSLVSTTEPLLPATFTTLRFVLRLIHDCCLACTLARIQLHDAVQLYAYARNATIEIPRVGVHVDFHFACFFSRVYICIYNYILFILYLCGWQ